MTMYQVVREDVGDDELEIWLVVGTKTDLL